MLLSLKMFKSACTCKEAFPSIAKGRTGDEIILRTNEREKLSDMSRKFKRFNEVWLNVEADFEFAGPV